MGPRTRGIIHKAHVDCTVQVVDHLPKKNTVTRLHDEIPTLPSLLGMYPPLRPHLRMHTCIQTNAFICKCERLHKNTHLVCAHTRKYSVPLNRSRSFCTFRCLSGKGDICCIGVVASLPGLRLSSIRRRSVHECRD